MYQGGNYNTVFLYHRGKCVPMKVMNSIAAVL